MNETTYLNSIILQYNSPFIKPSTISSNELFYSSKDPDQRQDLLNIGTIGPPAYKSEGIRKNPKVFFYDKVETRFDV